jgi:hypothetical protein
VRLEEHGAIALGDRVQPEGFTSPVKPQRAVRFASRHQLAPPLQDFSRQLTLAAPQPYY